MKTNSNKRKEANLLFLQKDSYNSSFNEINKISLNFHLNPFHKKNNSKNGRLYSNYNNVTKMNNFQNKYIDNSIINTYINSPTTNFKISNIDISNSNNDLSNKIKSRDNISLKEYEKDLQYKKNYHHHKKINSHLTIKNNQILNELFPNYTTSNSNKAKDSILNNKKKNGSKVIKKKCIQIDTNNINNNLNMNQTTKINTLSNNNNQHKINLKIYLEKHQRVLSTDNFNDNIKINFKNKKSEKKNNINSVIKNKRLITKKNSTQLLKNNALSRANSSWMNKEYNIFNASLEHDISKNIINKKNNKVKINNVIIKNINNIKEKKINNIELKDNDLIYLNKLKERADLYYLTNLNEDFKTKKQNYNKGNNIFISINNYTNDNKKKENKDNINLTEGKEINIDNYISKNSINRNDDSKIRKRYYLKKNEKKYKILGGSENSSQNKSEDNLNNSYNSDNDYLEGPELTHFFLVTTIQKGIKNTKNFN
jgi:hypothetical protein